MSSESWEEQGEAPGAGQRQDRQHVHKDTQRMMENQGQPDVEEQCRPLDDADEVLVSQNVNGDKNKRKEKRGTWRRRMDTQKIKTGHVKQADGTLPVSVSFVERDRNNRSGDIQGRGPFFFFGGNNGASIVVSYCESRGWQRVYDNTRVDYKLKWCETKSPATYYNFKAGSQLVYQIPNNKVLTTKIGLLNSLREYDRISSYGRGHRTMRMEDFFPLTFRMDMRDEREAFLNRICNDTTSMWICKPSGLNQGRGIFLLRTPEDITAFREKLQNQSEQQSDRKSPFSMPQARIVQQYIQNPLLIKGRKFDVRSYFLIACTSPYMVFFRHGYVRLTCNLYDPNSDNLTAHLTNQYMQKKNPLYSELKEDTVWSMERFNTFINEMYMLPRDLPKDWVLGPFAKRMQNIIMQCFLAVKAKLECKLGYFDLIGCDFMIDENFKVWLLEMNCNPALHTNCEVLKEVVPKTVTETLDITLEIFKKCCCGLKLLPLESQRDFVLLYGGEPTLVAKQRHKTTVPYSTLHPKNTFTHNNTSKKNRAATIATPTGESTNRCNMSPASVATTETALKLPVSQPPVLSPSSSTSSSAAINFLSSKTLPSQQPVKVQTKRPLGVAAMTQKTQTTKASETNHPRSHQAKPFRARVELRLSNCTWQQPVVPPQIAAVRRALRSLPTPTLSKSFDSTQRLEAQGHQTDKGEHISCYLKTFKIDLAQPCSLQTVWTAMKEPREKENE